MSIAEKLISVAENVPKVFAAGKQTRSDDVEKAVSENGVRTDYRWAFRMTDYTGFNFRQGLVCPKGAVSLMFNNYYGEQLPLGIHCANPEGTILPALGTNETFRNSYQLKRIYDFGIPPAYGYTSTFYGCRNVETIEKIRVVENTTFDSSFVDCGALRDIRIEGIIGENISFQWSILLTYATVKNIVYALKNFIANDPDNAFTRTISFPSEIKAMLRASSDSPDKAAADYTYTQYMNMTAEEQAAFQALFPTNSRFKAWYTAANDRKKNGQEATVGDNLIEYLDSIGWNY